MGGKSKPTIGYWYKPLLHLGFCQGPVDAVLELRGGDKTAWTGVQSESGVIYIDAKELWGGEKAEGGIQGDFDVMMGEPDQMPSAYLAANLGPDQSAFRGKVTGVFQGGLYGAFNPYPKPLAMKTRRILKGWDDDVCWYPEKAAIEITPPTPQDTVFTEQFTEGLAPYTSPSSTLSDFTIISGGESVIEIAGTVYDSRIIRSFAGGPLKKIELEFSMVTIAPDDFGVMDLFSATDSYAFGFVILRELAFSEGLRRPAVNFTGDGFSGGAGTLMGDGAVDLEGEWYSFEATYNSDRTAWDCVLRQGTSVLDEFSVPVTGPIEAGKIQFRSQGTGGVGRFANVRLTVNRSIGGSSAMNAVHIIYDSITHPQMQGEPQSLIDDDNFRAAADRAFSEGFGLCTEYDATSETVEDFQKRILNVLGASLSQSRTDGKYRLTLVRDDYVLEDLPILRDDNILEYSEEATDPLEAVNQVSVEWFDPARKETRTAGPLQSLGAIQAAGGVIAETVQHPEIPYEDLALRVGARNLGTKSVGLKRFELTTDRTPYAWRGGQFFRLQAPRRGIADMVCMVGDLGAGTRRSGAMRLQAIQDVSRMPMTTYVVPEPGVDTSPGQAPGVPPNQVAFEAPYVELAASLPAGELAALAEDSGFLLAAASRPTAGLNFDLWTATGAEDLADRGDGDWSEAAVIVEAATETDTAFTLADASALDTVVVGQAALWDGEICRVDAIDATLLTVTLGRGCADTCPRPHAAGLPILFYGGSAANDSREYSDGETVSAKLLTRTSSALLPLAAAPALTVVMASRAARPYAPGKLRISDDVITDATYPALVQGEIVATWAHRDRILQDDQLVDESAASVGPEVGVAYTIRYYLDDVLDGSETLGGTAATPFTMSGAGIGRIEVEAAIGANVSWQSAIAHFAYSPTPLDARLTDAGDTRITDSGDRRLLD